MTDIAKDHENLDHIYGRIKDVLTQARSHAWQAVNASMVMSYWEVGRNKSARRAEIKGRFFTRDKPGIYCDRISWGQVYIVVLYTYGTRSGSIYCLLY